MSSYSQMWKGDGHTTVRVRALLLPPSRALVEISSKTTFPGVLGGVRKVNLDFSYDFRNKGLASAVRQGAGKRGTSVEARSCQYAPFSPFFCA